MKKGRTETLLGWEIPPASSPFVVFTLGAVLPEWPDKIIRGLAV